MGQNSPSMSEISASPGRAKASPLKLHLTKQLRQHVATPQHPRQTPRSESLSSNPNGPQVN
eukprot:2434735-Rhodomonas_salina.2